jgi:hypothetical protein
MTYYIASVQQQKIVDSIDRIRIHRGLNARIAVLFYRYIPAEHTENSPYAARSLPQNRMESRP